MDTALAARFPLEVLDRIRDVGGAPVDPGELEGLVEDASRRAHEGGVLLVFSVARLFADEHRR